MSCPKILVFALCFLSTLITTSQWKQTGGPTGGSAQDMVQLGSQYFLNASSGIYVSDDGGASWTLSNQGLPVNVGINTLVEVNGVLYISINQGGVYRSKDAGNTWEPINTGIERDTFYSLLVNGNHIYAAHANGGFFYSPDAGEHWYQRNEGIEGVRFNSFAILDGKLFAAGQHLRQPSEFPALYVTEDHGKTWTGIEVPELGPNGISSMLVVEQTLYVADDGQVHISKDEGASWNKTNILTYATITSLTQYENSVYATTSNGRYYHTNDEGVSWTLVQNTETFRFANFVHFIEDKVIMGTLEGLYESYDAGLTWKANNTGIRSLGITSLNANDDFIFAGTSLQGVFRSNDAGMSWEEVSNGIQIYNGFSINDIIIEGNTVYLGTGQGVYSSMDNGDNWKLNYIPEPNNKPTHRLAYDQGVFAIAEGASEIYLSTDDTETWTPTSTENLPANSGISALAVQGDTLIASSNNGEVYLSKDLGENWTNITIATGHDFVFVNNLKIIEGSLYAATTKGLYVKDSLEETWKPFVKYDPRNIYDVVVLEGVAYVATSEGFLRSERGREKWYAHNDGMGPISLKTVFYKDTQFYVGSSRNSVWKIGEEEVYLPPLDDDQDGIANEDDSCPNTLPGVPVNMNGCDVVVADAIGVKSINPSCPMVANGKLEIITTLTGYTMDVEISGPNGKENYMGVSVSEPLIVDNLAVGHYEVNITIPTILHQQLFGISIQEIEQISATKKVVDPESKTAVYEVSGSKSYQVAVNGKLQNFNFSHTGTNEIVLTDLNGYAAISIEGGSDCQGRLEENLILNPKPLLYPTVSSNKVYVLAEGIGSKIALYNLQGQMVYQKDLKHKGDNSMDISHLRSGMYLVHLTTEGFTEIYKIIKP